MTNAQSTRKRTTRPPRPQFVNHFKQWLNLRDEKDVIDERIFTERERLLDATLIYGEEDEKGNFFLDLPETVTFADRKGKVFQFTTLKRERHLTPAVPLPDSEKAEKLLRKRGLWLTPDQQKAIGAIQVACPFAEISISVDVNALVKAVFTGQITDREYDATLAEQRESFQFRPCES